MARTFSRTGKLSFLVSALFMAGLAQAQLAIQSVTAATQGGGEVIRIQMSEPLKQLPAGFAIQSPARIALDFAGAINASGKNLFEINQGNLRSANVVEAGDRTRVVLNLGQAVAYETRIDGNALLVTLQQPPVTTPVAGGAMGSVFAAPGVPSDVAALSDIDFRRGPENAGRVVVNLANNQTGVDIRQQGRNLVVEFLKTSLPEGLRRRMDVADFGTPIRMVTATQAGDRVRLLIEPTGNWEHSAYQSDNQFVLEVREVKTDPNQLTQGPNYSGEKLSLNFQNIEVRSLLQVIADFTNFNIVTSDSVTGSVTLRLKDVPWDQALDIVLQAKGLGMRKTGSVIWVAPQAEILAQEKSELEAKQALRVLEVPRTQSFRLNFATAEDVAKQLTTAVGSGEAQVRILSKQGSVFSEPRTNQIFVTDVASKLEEIAALIKKIDIPVKQVLIEARIVEATDDFSKRLGVRFGARSRPAQLSADGTTSTAPGASFGFGSLAPNSSNAFTTIPTGENFPESGLNPRGGLVALSLFNSGVTRLLNLEIVANESDGKIKTIASPKILTADQREALIQDGQRIPYNKQDQAGNTTTEFEEAVLALKVVPQITPDGDVIMKLEIKKDEPRLDSTGRLILVQKKLVETQVLVENGGTIVIGGIYTQQEGQTVDKVPGLGDIPVLGHLFKTRGTTTAKTELLVFITPRLQTESLASQR
ncbi:type IV pilus secretin family protein [Aquabacterium sp. A08]|uniref:type IV pilus secretin family protein n=1 Tax=Aquabacterium sp. A08 TaxID=2718532 RepID=UPI00141F8BAB|nr:type IV pilus secretin family protein [Aquabacterium sp. A08]NIC42464.1 type IV pilus secretin PilQ [Aquabacterium sp. A08]